MKSIETNWTEIKGKIKAKWGKFSDAELESFKSDLNQISDKIHTSYGIAKDQAQHQFEEFKKSVQSLTDPEMHIDSAKNGATGMFTASSKSSPGITPQHSSIKPEPNPKKESKAV